MSADNSDELVTLTRAELKQVAVDAGHQVGRLHRYRIARWSFGAAVLATIVVGLPIGIVIHNNTASSARKSALYDCRLNQLLAGDISNFVTSDAQLRVAQSRLAVTGPLLHDLEHVIPVGDLEAAASASTALSIKYAHKWTTLYLPPLQHLVTVDCATRSP